MSSSSATTATTATTTTTVLKPSSTPTRLSLPTAPAGRWQKPELSIGVQLPSLDHLGMYKCWSLKDKSPATLIWKNVYKPITQLLEDQFEHLDAKSLEFRFDMFMIGRKPEKAIPTILFGCKGKLPRQKAMDIVKKKGILDCHPGVEMAGCSRLPERLALEEYTELRPLPPGVYLNGSPQGCGISILVSRDGVAPPKKATIGGFVCIGDDIYGLTAAHAFGEGKELEDTPEQDFEFAFYGLETHNDSSDDEDDLMMTSQGSVSSSSSNSLDSDWLDGSDVALPQNLSNSGQGSSPDSGSTEQKLSQPLRIGTIFQSAPPEDALDWALVRIENISQFFPDLVGRRSDPVSIRKVEGDRVLICLGTFENAVEGTLSDVPSFSKAPGSKVFQDFWQVSRLDGSFVDGDCGSWVLDLDSGDLIGYIVSGYNQSGIAYIIPAEQVFRDIQYRLGKSVEFSTRSRMMFRDQIRNPLTHASAITPLVRKRLLSEMADPVSIGASVLTLAAASIQSVICLYDAIKCYQSRDKTLRRLLDELQDLINILNQLERVATVHETSTLKLLGGPIGRCGELCSEFEEAMKSFSENSKVGVRDWMKMEFMRGNINTFIETLGGYKSTITIGLGTVIISTSKQTHQVLEEYLEVVMDTIYGLEVHLGRIEDYLTHPATDSTAASNVKVDLQDEREVTKQCLHICKDAKSYLETLQDKESSLLDGTPEDNIDSPPDQFEAQLSTNRGLGEARDKFAEIVGRLQERLDTMGQNGGPERSLEMSRLQEEINMQKQCLEVCKRVSNQVADKKVHTFGEIIAEGESDQMVITTLADLFDVKKAWSKSNSAQMIGSTTEEALIKISADRYGSRFGAVTPQVRVATETRRSNPLPPTEARKDAQLADPEKRQNRQSSNSVRKRTNEGD